MRVFVYKRVAGQAEVLVIPDRQLRLPPLVLQGVTSENRAERILAAVQVAAGPMRVQSALPGL